MTKMTKKRVKKSDGGPFHGDTQVCNAAVAEHQPGGGRGVCDTHEVSAPASVVSALRELQAQRVHVIRQMTRSTNAVYALARRYLGYQGDLPEKERKAIAALAQASVKAIFDGKPAPPAANGIADALGDTIMADKQSRLPYEHRRKAIEAAMGKLAKSLPVWESWAEGVKGFGAPGLAAIVGECGDLSNYANPGKLWKRLGLAPGECYRSVTLAGEVCYKKPKRRRSVLWNIGQALLKADGEYRAVYLARKAQECEKAVAEGLTVTTTTKATVESWARLGLPEPVYTKKFDKATMRSCGHIDIRAQRYMEKRLLRDLWKAWNGGGHEPDDTHSEAAPADI
jgi:hypothetical protein